MNCARSTASFTSVYSPSTTLLQWKACVTTACFHSNSHFAIQTTSCHFIKVCTSYLSTCIGSSETWPVTIGLKKKLEVAQRAMWRTMLGVSLRDVTKLARRISRLKWHFLMYITVFNNFKKILGGSNLHWQLFIHFIHSPQLSSTRYNVREMN